MNIRTETIADIAAIEALTYQAFENHPHHPAGAKPNEQLIINRLRDTGALVLSLVAEHETDIIGHIAFSPVTICIGESEGEDKGRVASNWYGLGPVSVAPKHQRKGIGGQLITTGITQIKALGAQGVVLLGEPEYYSRFGFKADANLTLAGVPAKYFLILPLADTQSVPIGEVTYHSAFS